ncbi:hypothetical protein MPL3365_270008 [Mesorhizobium plurifarium]|uniref:Uncharacterized protein n=1 Tax=Mesorhizobium plurifarium TaxID=69974 RepID=A0A090G5N2_MESPL|nr:hypothetical protein MPL3365_270008 [Mesorhizobium plurifarium]
MLAGRRVDGRRDAKGPRRAPASAAPCRTERGCVGNEAPMHLGYCSSLKFGDFGRRRAFAAGVAAAGHAGSGISRTTVAPASPVSSPTGGGEVGWGPGSAPGDGCCDRITPAFSSCSRMPFCVCSI